MASDCILNRKALRPACSGPRRGEVEVTADSRLREAKLCILLPKPNLTMGLKFCHWSHFFRVYVAMNFSFLFWKGKSYTVLNALALLYLATHIHHEQKADTEGNGYSGPVCSDEMGGWDRAGFQALHTKARPSCFSDTMPRTGLKCSFIHCYFS